MKYSNSISRCFYTFLLFVNACGPLAFSPVHPKQLPQFEPLEPDMGLVVGEIAAVGQGTVACVVDPTLMIDGEPHGNLTRGLVVLPLKSGTYQLDELRWQIGGGGATGHSGGVIVRVTEVKTWHFPIGRKFTVKAGHVTNLGLLVLGRPNDSPGTATRLENQADMQHLLRTYYPTLRAQLAEPMLAATTPADAAVTPEHLSSLRQQVVTEAATYPVQPTCCVVGALGAFAETVLDEQGAPTALDMVSAPTVSNIWSSAHTSKRAAFTTATGRLFVFANGRIEERALPSALSNPVVAVGGERELVVVDDKGRIYASRDDGMTFRAVNQLGAAQAGFYFVHAGGAGYYIYRSDWAHLAYVPYGSATAQSMALPEDISSVGNVFESASHVFVEEDYSGYMEVVPRRFYVRDNAGNWQTRRMPRPNCNKLRFEGNSGSVLLADCGDRAPPLEVAATALFVSRDVGATWQPGE